MNNSSIGKFRVGRRNVFAHLQLDGGSSVVKLYSDSYISVPTSDTFDLQGTLEDGTICSLLECVVMSVRPGGASSQHEVEVFPHFVVFGRVATTSSERKVRAIRYSFENSDCLVSGRETFGSASVSPVQLKRMIAAERARSGRPRPIPAAINVGENPIVMYWNGLSEVSEIDAPYGRVKLRHQPQFSSGSSKGIGVTSTMFVDLEFQRACMLETGVKRLMEVHRFLELVLGHRQRYASIQIELAVSRNNKERVDLFWCMANDRLTGQGFRTSTKDVLFNLEGRREEFENVFTKYLEQEPKFGEARTRFATAMHTQSFSIDRLVSAANMFDILPSEAVPARAALTPPVKEIADSARLMFRGLPEGPERQRLLGDLGRLGQPTLRSKVRHRADFVIATDPQKFAELHLPCDEAVRCRNHYVHGSEGSFNYTDEVNLRAFLTETLEFVFGASDLVAQGWDINAWRAQGSSLSHPFALYLFGYDRNIQALKTAVATN